MGHNSPMGAGLRERKKAMTRRALQDAAIELFARQGFEQTTVDEIADACDISPRTFFRYFATKEDVLFGDADERRATLVQAIAERPLDEATIDTVREAVCGLAAAYEGDRPRMVAKSEILAGNPTLRSRGVERQRDWEAAVTEALLQRDLARRREHSMLELRLVAGVAMVALRAACDTWVVDGGDLTPLVAEAFDRIASGLDV
jgi:TetR/AcrR family transcriptional regulator, regulator of mycofactocin system